MRRRLAAAMRIGVVVLLILACGLAGAVPVAATARKAPDRASCRPGQLPLLTGSGRKTKVVRDRRGRPRCARPKRPSLRALPRASGPTPSAQLGVIADHLQAVTTVQPDALKPVVRKIGPGRTQALLAIALRSWRARAVAAVRPPHAQAADTRSDRYTPVDGGEVTFSGDFQTIADGQANGFSGKATVEGAFDRRALDELAKKADATLPEGVGDSRFTLALDFADRVAGCPDAAGKVQGSLRAGGRITLRAGGASVTLAARIEVDYRLQVGDDARWKTIDAVDVRTELSVGGTGRSTETWRGRRVGNGFGTDAIFGGTDGKAAILRDLRNLDPDQGGVFGPRGGVNFATGKGTLLDVRSIDNLKKMIATDVATQLITLAAVEYVRKVAAERAQKHWYDDEACLKLDASAAKAKLRPGQTTTVTARNARAADGQPVSANLTATGVQALEPAAAPLPAGSSKDFILTAPPTSPARSSWRIQALSRAGKKTVTGDLADEVPAYVVTLNDAETASFATHDASATLGGTLTLQPVTGSTPQRWTDLAPVTWSAITATAKIDCSYVDPTAAGTWSVTITDVGGDRIRVELGFSSETTVSFTVLCPDAPPIHGQPGPRPVGLGPLSFELPAGGGVQPLSGSVAQGADGFFSNGTLTVTPAAP